MNIRQATINDLPGLADLWQERMVIIGQIDPRFAQNIVDLETWIAQEKERIQANNWQIIAAKKDDTVIGYIAGYIQTSLVGNGEETNQCGIIEEIVLDAHTYHSGLGRGLYTAIMTWFDAQDIQQILIKSPRYYAVEQAFWRALGAKEWLPKRGESSNWNVSPGCIWMTL